MEKHVGIYKISFIGSNETYIGQSMDVPATIKKYKTLLKKGKHYNPKLQECYDKYGEKIMEIDILQYCEKDSLDYLEQYYINKYKMLYKGKTFAIEDIKENN